MSGNYPDLSAPNQLLQPGVCCNQASMDASARLASKAAARRVWIPADKQNKLKEVDPRYVGEDIDLGTVTPEQLLELRRRAAVAKEEHEHAMAKKREEHAAQQLEKEIEELRLQKLRLREEAARLLLIARQSELREATLRRRRSWLPRDRHSPRRGEARGRIETL